MNVITELLTVISDFMASAGVIRIMARFSSPVTCRAIESIGFENDGHDPTFMWDKSGTNWEEAPTSLTFLRGDDSIRLFS